MAYRPHNIHNLSCRIDKNPYLLSTLKEFLKMFKCIMSSSINMIVGQLDLIFKTLHQEIKDKKEKKIESFHKACVGNVHKKILI